MRIDGNQLNVQKSVYQKSTPLQNNNSNNQNEQKTNRRNRDILVLNPNGRNKQQNSMLENLLDSKQKLTERKNEMIKNALENGDSPKTITSELAELEEQMQKLDEQISKTMLEAQREKMGLDEDKKEEENKTNASGTDTETEAAAPEEAQAKIATKQMNGIVALDSSISDIKTVSSVKTAAMGERGVLKSEIALDEARSQGQAATAKRTRVSEIEGNISKMTSFISGKINEVNNQIKNESNAEAAPKSDSDVKSGESGAAKSGESNAENTSGENSSESTAAKGDSGDDTTNSNS